MKISDKDIVGYYKDKYLSVYWEGMYKECEKYLVDDKYFYYFYYSKNFIDYLGDKYFD